MKPALTLLTTLLLVPLAALHADDATRPNIPPKGEPTNAKEAAAQKAKAEAIIDERYQALVAKMPPDQQAWERVLQENLGGFYLPHHKREKVAGASNAWDFVQDDPQLPRVLLIGDSVSRGYTQAVRKALAGKANVYRALANYGPTATGLKKIDVWLGDGKWDVIHFNFGIHDRATPISDYTQRLEQLIERMKQTGAKVVDRLSIDLRAEFPEMGGFSRSNLLYMRAFAEAYRDEQIVQQLVGQIPWGHNVVLLTRIKNPADREWYARKTIEHGWSRAVLTLQIESRAHARTGRAITNFDRTLPPEQSDLAREVLKDPYTFDFLTLADDAIERDLEQQLLTHIEKFLLELGVGFAFVGRQVRLDVDGDEFVIDLLFYHLKLRCYFVIDLKMKRFRPEDAGQMSFYLTVVDEQLRHPDDQPSIGLLLCKDSKNRVTVEYALRNIKQPIGVAEWTTQLVNSLPQELERSLPSVAELERQLSDVPSSSD